MKKTVVLGVTSGIAAYKILTLVKELKKNKVDVFVVATNTAKKMIDESIFQKASGHKVYSELFEKDFDYKEILKKRKVDHINLADIADVICIAPITANTLAKIAQGIADDFLTTMVLASNSPVILCPSMNVHMWNNPATQDNIQILKKRGFIIISPEEGRLACGYEGPGRLPHIEKIKKEIDRQIVNSHLLDGKTVVVTAGATKEYIDDVRFITNNSSGKMGISLADECYLFGAKVILLKAKDAVTSRYLYNTVSYETVEELENLLMEYSPTADIIFHTAAIGDFRLRKKSGKISSKKNITMNLAPQNKLSSLIKKINQDSYLVLFKAEWNLCEKELILKARKKLNESDADVVIVNDVSKKDAGFASDTNKVILVKKKEEIKLPNQGKQILAKKIIESLFINSPKNL